MAKKLIFTEDCGRFESEEFQVNGDFNLHVERELNSNLTLYQKTAGNKFSVVAGSALAFNQPNVDVDVQVLVPKTFKVASGSPVTDAYITEGV